MHDATLGGTARRPHPEIAAARCKAKDVMRAIPPAPARRQSRPSPGRRDAGLRQDLDRTAPSQNATPGLALEPLHN